MATYEVSTWAEFVAALSNDIAEAKTIKLIDDINCNDEIPEGVLSTINVYSSATYPVVVDGSYTEENETKNHVIRNLRTHVTSPVNIFNFYQPSSQSTGNKYLNTIFKNVDFINLILEGGAFVGVVNSGSSGGNYIQFNNCRFVGRRKNFLVNSTSFIGNGNGLIFTSCFFNIPFNPTGTENTYVPLNDVWTKGDVTANHCRFREYYNNWTIGDYNPSSSRTPHTSTYNMNLNGCYIDGTIVGYRTAICISNYYSYNATIQNVVDADLRVVNDSGSDTVNIYAPKGIYKTAENNNTNVVKKYGDDTVNYPISNQNTSAIPETPNRMISPSDLYTDGFDIVVPE